MENGFYLQPLTQPEGASVIIDGTPYLLVEVEEGYVFEMGTDNMSRVTLHEYQALVPARITKEPR